MSLLFKTNLASRELGALVLDPHFDEEKGREKWLEDKNPLSKQEGFESCPQDEKKLASTIISLAAPGSIDTIEIDTSHFLIGHAPYALLEATYTKDPLAKDTHWTSLLPKTSLEGHSKNTFSPKAHGVFSHIRLKTPQGGIARLRLYGECKADFLSLDANKDYELTGLLNGAKIIALSDPSILEAKNLLLPFEAKSKQDGLLHEKKEGFFLTIALSKPGFVSKVTLDTSTFKDNFIKSAFVESIHSKDLAKEKDVRRQPLLENIKLTSAKKHVFLTASKEKAPLPTTHIKLTLPSPGGLSRLRVFGAFDLSGSLNELKTQPLLHGFLKCCHIEDWAKKLIQKRPYSSTLDLLEKSSAIWQELKDSDFHKALDGHPKIGSKNLSQKKQSWEKKEQSGASDPHHREIFASLNQTYFEKFGYIFLICASGQSASSLLSALEKRLQNSKEDEWPIVKKELKKITHLRLVKLSYDIS